MFNAQNRIRQLMAERGRTIYRLAHVSVILSSCSDELDIQQSYPFKVETMMMPLVVRSELYLSLTSARKPANRPLSLAFRTSPFLAFHSCTPQEWNAKKGEVRNARETCQSSVVPCVPYLSLLGVPLLWCTGYACGNGCTFSVNGDAAKYVGGLACGQHVLVQFVVGQHSQLVVLVVPHNLGHVGIKG